MENLIKIEDKEFKPYLTNAQIESAIDEVAKRIIADYEGTGKCPIIMCVLEGSLMFTSELMKRLTIPCELMSVKMTSYSGTQSTGVVKQTMGLSRSIEGREVIVCEDIVDTGCTIKNMLSFLTDNGASRVKICTLLLKPDVYRNDIPLDYVALEIENKFIVGFGLDYNQQGRNLPDIYQINE